MVGMAPPHCIVKEIVAVQVLPREPREDVPEHFNFKRRTDDHGTSVLIVGDCLNIVRTVNGTWRLRSKRMGMIVRWAQNVLHHLFKTRSWTPRAKHNDWVEHTFRENNKIADDLANEGATNGGLETLRQLHADCNKRWKYLKAYWDGSIKADGGGGCGWILFGANELKGEEGNPEWKPIFLWLSGVVKAKHNNAAFMETCAFTTLLMCLKNLAQNVEVATFPRLLEVALNDDHFQHHWPRTF